MDYRNHKTMELRVSQNEAELQQAISARRSNRSMSTIERDELERRVQQLQQEKIKLEKELARCKVTIQTQSQIIQKPQSSHKALVPYSQQHPDPRNAHQLPGSYPRPVPPPQFDASGAYQSPYQQASKFPQPSQNHVSPPNTNPYPASLPGTLGYGLTMEQRAQPTPPTPVKDQRAQLPAPTPAKVQQRGGYNADNIPPKLPLYPRHYTNPYAKQLVPLIKPSSDNTRPANQLVPLAKPSSENPHPADRQQQVPQPVPATSMALVKHTDTPEDLGFPAKFKALFTMSEKFSFAHVNFPSTSRDGMLPTYIKAKLELAAGNSAGNLMSNGQTRYHVVARVMSQWIIKHVLRRGCFSGLDKDVDANIERLANSIYQTTPASVRSNILSNIGQEVKRLTARPDFQDFFNQTCKNRGNDLWAIVFPMMNRKTSKDWEDMMSLMVEAHNLAGMMLGGPYEWAFTFHDIGARFQPSTMENKDPFMKNLTDAELEKKGAVVRLGVSPLVVARTYSTNGTKDVSTVASAFVLVKWPQF